MLDEIHVENLALIRQASLRFDPGLTVLTGETGAGKTALLTACRLLIGERADKSMVAEGASELRLSGRVFRTMNPKETSSSEEGALDDEELVITRSVSADGRSRVSINGALASVSQLASLLSPSIDLCSQHEHQQLLKASHQRHVLDQWGAQYIAAPKTAYEEAFDRVVAARETLKAFDERARRSEAELEAARFALKAIETIDPVPGEYEELSALIDRSSYAEALTQAAEGAYEYLANEHGALDQLYGAQAALRGAVAHDANLEALASRLSAISIDMDDVAKELRTYRDSVDFDPAMLTQAQERRAALRGLMRSYGPTMDEVFKHRDEVRLIVETFDGDSLDRDTLVMALAEAEATLKVRADALAAARAVAAPLLSAQVTDQMKRLRMGGASFECALEDLDYDHWTRQGSQEITFLFSPGSTLSARPLARIASGGELSRVMLAIKVVLGTHDDVETLIFDEIDAGVGGETANALGEVIADLAQSHQVIVVTHLASVAAFAQRHYRVFRDNSEERPITALELITGDARTEEIARLLSGDATDISLAHAEELLKRSVSRF